MKKYKTVALFFAGFVLFDGISVLNFFIRDTNEYWIMYLVFVMGLWCLFYAIYLLRQPCIKSREFDPSYVKNPLEYLKKSYQNTDLLLAILIFTTFIVGGFLYITTIISEIMRGA